MPRASRSVFYFYHNSNHSFLVSYTTLAPPTTIKWNHFYCQKHTTKANYLQRNKNGCVFVCDCSQASLHQHHVMEALISTCTKAIVVDMLGTHHVPKCAPHVSNTPRFSLSPSDKKGCIFGFPKLVQNKGGFPLHAVPAKTMVDLDSLVLQAQQPPPEPKTVNITFQLQRICNFGEQFLVVGNDPMFGSWNPANAIPMTWSEGHVWTVEMAVPCGKFQFKYIMKRREGEIIWQPGPDRIIHTWEAMTKITVLEDWDNAQLQKVTEDGEEVPKTMEEDQVAQPTKEQQIESSEMPNFVENLGLPKETKMKSNSNVPKVMKSTR